MNEIGILLDGLEACTRRYFRENATIIQKNESYEKAMGLLEALKPNNTAAVAGVLEVYRLAVSYDDDRDDDDDVPYYDAEARGLVKLLFEFLLQAPYAMEAIVFDTKLIPVPSAPTTFEEITRCKLLHEAERRRRLAGEYEPSELFITMKQRMAARRAAREEALTPAEADQQFQEAAVQLSSQNKRNI